MTKNINNKEIETLEGVTEKRWMIRMNIMNNQENQKETF